MLPVSARRIPGISARPYYFEDGTKRRVPGFSGRRSVGEVAIPLAAEAPSTSHRKTRSSLASPDFT